VVVLQTVVVIHNLQNLRFSQQYQWTWCYVNLYKCVASMSPFHLPQIWPWILVVSTHHSCLPPAIQPEHVWKTGHPNWLQNGTTWQKCQCT